MTFIKLYIWCDFTERADMIEGFDVGRERFIYGNRQPLDNILFPVNYCHSSSCDLCKAICVNNTGVHS